MDRLLAILAVVFLAAAIFLGWRLDKSSDFIDQQARTIGNQENKLSEKNSQLLAVDLMARANDSLQLGLQQRNAQLAAGAASRDQRLKGLMDEKPEVKRWDDVRLPDDVIRLQQRPTITGADGYHTYLSGSNTVQSASQSASD